jgi:hypothetical protein
MKNISRAPGHQWLIFLNSATELIVLLTPLITDAFSISIFIFAHILGGKFEPVLIDNAYKVVMKLNIKTVSQSDFGSYRCVAKNSLGDTDGTIKLYSKLEMLFPLQTYWHFLSQSFLAARWIVSTFQRDEEKVGFSSDGGRVLEAVLHEAKYRILKTSDEKYQIQNANKSY